MTTWNDFHDAAPELATSIAARFDAHLHHVMATLRADGSPRVSGTEARFFDGNLYLGSMPGSRKGADLRRDPRLALHAATIDVELIDGDAKIAGRAIEVDRDEATRFLSSLSHAPETGAPETADVPEVADAPIDGVVFAVDITEATLTQVAGDELVIRTWTPGGEVRTIHRK